MQTKVNQPYATQHIHAGARGALLGIALLFAPPLALAEDFVVTSTADSGDGTLRDALIRTNVNSGTHRILFDIPGDGPHTIAPQTPLPTIESAGLLLDGYSQPGAAPNTIQDDANDAVLQVRLQGGATGVPIGIAICATGVRVRGFAITGFASHGVTVGATSAGALCAPGAANDARVQGNFIGIAPDGLSAAGNGTGVFVTHTTGAAIGGIGPADHNLISANSNRQISFNNAPMEDTFVVGNLIGSDASGSLDPGPGASNGITLGNGSSGVRITANVIAFQHNGIVVASSARNNELGDNRYLGNTGLAIDLSAAANADGVTPNDADDVDAGGNDLQNFPVLTQAVLGTDDRLAVAGTLDVPASGTLQQFRIQLYADPGCESSGHGAGATLLSSVAIDFEPGGPETFAFDLPVNGVLLPGDQISAIATDAAGNTSEFSACFPLEVIAVAPPHVVTTTADSGPGSLRQAMLDANTGSGPQRIEFAIPGDGVQVIEPLSTLPTIEIDELTLDGYTQPGASPNTLAVGDDALIRIVVDGSNTAALGVSGFGICAHHVTIRGLAIGGFEINAISIGTTSDGVFCGNPGSGEHARIAGNFLGLLPDGSTPLANGSGLRVTQSASVTIGGFEPADRNVIAGNGFGQIAVSNVPEDGPLVLSNYLGTDASGTLDLGGQGDVVSIDNGSGAILLADNRIGFGRNGIVIDHTSQRVELARNEVFGNSQLGIDLVAALGGPDGVTPNDPGDGDTGGNHLQNFPVLDSVALGEDQHLHVAGSLDRPDAGADQAFELHFHASAACDASGHGPGETYLATKTVFFPANAPAAFDLDIVPVTAPPPGSQITATATDEAGNTSEFSACLALPLGERIFAHGFESEDT